jgi:NAD(P)-dependent dehydrogenase (short-subunit alcohol dehydrogenase family)
MTPVAVVTGGASGIGAATATRLASDGYRVVILDRQVELGREHAGAVGGRFYDADVADPTAWRNVLADVVATDGRLDVVHLNAGVACPASEIDSVTDENLDHMLDVNVRGVVYGARAATQVLKKLGKGGALVVTASVAGISPYAGDPLYTLTKHAVVGFVRAASRQLVKHDITINAICPGVVDTPLLPDDTRRRLGAHRIHVMAPADVAEAIVTVLAMGSTGGCWICLPGRPLVAHSFNDPRRPRARTRGR